MKISFVTSSEDPSLTKDDRLAIPALNRLGHDVSPMIWDQNPDFAEFDALIFRSCWDYHLKQAEFIAFLDKLDRSGVLVLNSAQNLLWNLNKKHLLELQTKGIPIPETRWLPKGSVWIEDPAQFRSEKIVLKPAVSLNGYDTYLVSRTSSGEMKRYAELILGKSDLIAQEYLPEIETSGELSFVFFDGEFSHAVRKLPKAGEFRIHEEYGGSRVSFEPSPSQIAQAANVIEQTGFDTLYARVDVLERAGRLILIELEILDPSLYLADDPRAAERFAKAIDNKLRWFAR